MFPSSWQASDEAPILAQVVLPSKCVAGNQRAASNGVIAECVQIS
jgi:hypothetical protein